MAGVGSFLYNALFKRTSTFALTIIGGSFFFERSFEMISDSMYDNINQGVGYLGASQSTPISRCFDLLIDCFCAFAETVEAHQGQV
jgi:ubiquinol-cytochrome c reductase subunit 9